MEFAPNLIFFLSFSVTSALVGLVSVHCPCWKFCVNLANICIISSSVTVLVVLPPSLVLLSIVAGIRPRMLLLLLVVMFASCCSSLVSKAWIFAFGVLPPPCVAVTFPFVHWFGRVLRLPVSFVA